MGLFYLFSGYFATFICKGSEPVVRDFPLFYPIYLAVSTKID
jgi:hypothetical protein